MMICAMILLWGEGRGCDAIVESDELLKVCFSNFVLNFLILSVFS